MSSPLKLSYDFTPDPNPIRCSDDDANPNVVTLTVTISNPSTQSVQVASITIAIPCGAEDSRSLTSSPDLPAPSGVSSSDWTVDTHATNPQVQAGTIRIKPASGTTQPLGGTSIVFRLANIKVNKTPSASVPITITEFTPDKLGPDNTTYYLEKLASTEMVSSFTATPATLDDLDQVTTLSWSTTTNGAKCTFELMADDSRQWHPRNCVAAGSCFTPQDGVNGVTTDPLVPVNGSVITFTLNVIVADTSGMRSVYARKTTKVQVGTPSVSPNSYMNVLANGRIVDLHWTTTNASYCTVSLDDGTVLVDDAPTDTYVDGYKLLMSKDGHYNVVVTAWGAAGTAHMDHTMAQRVSIPAAVAIASGAGACSPVVSVDGATLVVGTSAGLIFTDLKTLQQQLAPVQGGASDVSAIGPTSIFVTTTNSHQLTPVGVASRQAQAAFTMDMLIPYGVAQTADGRYCVVALRTYGTGVLGRLETATATFLMNAVELGKAPAFIAVTPDALHAVVGDFVESVVRIVDLTTWAAPTLVPVPNPPASHIVITPDNSTALVPNGDCLSVIDIGTATVKQNITVPCYSPAIALTQKGDFVFVVNNDSGAEIRAVDLSSMTPVNGAITLPNPLSGLALLPNTPSIVVTTLNTQTATIL